MHSGNKCTLLAPSHCRSMTCCNTNELMSPVLAQGFSLLQNQDHTGILQCDVRASEWQGRGNSNRPLNIAYQGWGMLFRHYSKDQLLSKKPRHTWVTTLHTANWRHSQFNNGVQPKRPKWIPQHPFVYLLLVQPPSLSKRFTNRHKIGDHVQLEGGLHFNHKNVVISIASKMLRVFFFACSTLLSSPSSSIVLKSNPKINFSITSASIMNLNFASRWCEPSYFLPVGQKRFHLD